MWHQYSLPCFALVLCSALACALALPERAPAQDEMGCCEFSASGNRRCGDLTRDECMVLKTRGVFLRGRQCDADTQQCVLMNAGGRPTATPTATPVPHVARRGCCQLNNLPRTHNSVCGNDVDESDCLSNFAGAATFCADCECSSHSDPGFDIDPGICVPRPTPTPTAVEPHGCCQLDNLPGARSSVCGNDIAQSVCLTAFAGQPTFCAKCKCSSHSGAGIDVSPGTCIAPPSGRPRRQPHRPNPPHLPGH